MTEATALVTTTSVGRQTDRPVFSGGTGREELLAC